MPDVVHGAGSDDWSQPPAPEAAPTDPVRNTAQVRYFEVRILFPSGDEHKPLLQLVPLHEPDYPYPDTIPEGIQSILTVDLITTHSGNRLTDVSLSNAMRLDQSPQPNST